jgi:hypothetical protein
MSMSGSSAVIACSTISGYGGTILITMLMFRPWHFADVPSDLVDVCFEGKEIADV